mmetsp:Transcript_56759/g.135192  ORF Transcript_56759/g.135192 Transcript_56759/m.135192 type:complete len:353 (-) Transcript_56759:187-1245(-)
MSVIFTGAPSPSSSSPGGFAASSAAEAGGFSAGFFATSISVAFLLEGGGAAAAGESSSSTTTGAGLNAAGGGELTSTTNSAESRSLRFAGLSLAATEASFSLSCFFASFMTAGMLSDIPNKGNVAALEAGAVVGISVFSLAGVATCCLLLRFAAAEAPSPLRFPSLPLALSAGASDKARQDALASASSLDIERRRGALEAGLLSKGLQCQEPKTFSSRCFLGSANAASPTSASSSARSRKPRSLEKATFKPSTVPWPEGLGSAGSNHQPASPAFNRFGAGCGLKLSHGMPGSLSSGSRFRGCGSPKSELMLSPAPMPAPAPLSSSAVTRWSILLQMRRPISPKACIWLTIIC